MTSKPKESKKPAIFLFCFRKHKKKGLKDIYLSRDEKKVK
jgi:hypothetical protein